jgi:FxsC-like protein
VNRIGTGLSGLPSKGSYFYLSYAQSPPLAGTVQDDPDHWVRAFHRDLSDAVRAVASPHSSLGQGVFNQEISLRSGWKADLTAALSSAEVFVPLYSPGYFARSWPGREWACFFRRLITAGVESPIRRFAPVLWTPLPPDLDPPGPWEAMPGAVPEYAENGLRTLLRLRPYRQSYEQSVRRLAAHIVDLAENSPVRPSDAPDIDQVQSEFRPEANGLAFAVTVAAPAATALSAGRDRTGYRAHSVDWRPYPGGQELPLAQHAARIAEQLGLAVIMNSIEKQGGQLTSWPGVVLIDPWFIGNDQGRADFESYIRQLPAWVLPLLILHPHPDARSMQLSDQIRGMLSNMPRGRGEVTSRAIAGVDSLASFAALMPYVAAEAGRQYLRHGPVARSAPRVSRPRLADGLSPSSSRMAGALPDREGE